MVDRRKEIEQRLKNRREERQNRKRTKHGFLFLPKDFEGTGHIDVRFPYGNEYYPVSVHEWGVRGRLQPPRLCKETMYGQGCKLDSKKNERGYSLFAKDFRLYGLVSVDDCLDYERKKYSKKKEERQKADARFCWRYIAMPEGENGMFWENLNAWEADGILKKRFIRLRYKDYKLISVELCDPSAMKKKAGGELPVIPDEVKDMLKQYDADERFAQGIYLFDDRSIDWDYLNLEEPDPYTGPGANAESDDDDDDDDEDFEDDDEFDED